MLRRSGYEAAIADFWGWWSGARERVAAGIADGTIASMAGEIGERVAAIDDELQWELTPGRVADHCLVVTSAGNPPLRATVSRWLAAAPPADAVFEYAGSRQPDDRVFASRIRMDQWELDLSAIRFGFAADEDGHSLDVAVFHPRFPEMPEPDRMRLAFLALDWALGEEQVELWIGEIHAPSEAPGHPRTVAELRATVDEMAARHAEPVYAMLQAQTENGRPLLAMVQVPLKAARWPRFDTHVAVSTGYPAGESGLPDGETLARLRDHEDAVAAAVGGDGEIVAHETCEGVRTLHVYVDGGTPAAEAATAVARSGPYDGAAEVTYDPRYELVAHLRV